MNFFEFLSYFLASSAIFKLVELFVRLVHTKYREKLNAVDLPMGDQNNLFGDIKMVRLETQEDIENFIKKLSEEDDDKKWH